MKQIGSPLLAVILSTLFTSCAWHPAAEETTNTATFQMRAVLDGPADDATEMIVVQNAERPAPKETLYVRNTALLDQTALKSARVEGNNFGLPQIALTFSDAGREQFAEVTRQNIGKRLAIVIDGRLYSAPTILTEISGGKATVTGNFTEHEAQELVAGINASVTRRTRKHVTSSPTVPDEP